MGTYEIWLTDDGGARIAVLDSMEELAMTRIVSGIGSFVMTLPASFDLRLLAPDRMVQVWRAPNGGAQGLWRTFFVRKLEFKNIDGREQTTISGPDVCDLLRRRIVAAYAYSPQAEKREAADDMLKALVRESLLDTAEPVPAAGTRALPGLSVQANLSAGPTISKAFAYRVLLDDSGGGALSSICAAARQAGTEVFFDIVPNVVTANSISFRFETYVGQPGLDVSSAVVFEPGRGNLLSPVLLLDYSDEVNYVYAGGAGEGTARDIQQAYDASRYTLSRWNRREAFTNASGQAELPAAVLAAARDRLRAGEPRLRFSGQLVDTLGTQFGVHWNLGDTVTVRYRAYQFAALVRTVSISVKGGQEAIAARIDVEESI